MILDNAILAQRPKNTKPSHHQPIKKDAITSFLCLIQYGLIAALAQLAIFITALLVAQITGFTIPFFGKAIVLADALTIIVMYPKIKGG